MGRVSATVVTVFIVSLGAPPRVHAQPASPEALLELGRRQFADGDFEAALFTLDAVVRKMPERPDSPRLLTRAYVYLGACYVGLDREDVARGKFRQALRISPQLRLSPEEFPARTIKVFERELLAQTVSKKKGAGKALLIAGAVGGAAAVAVASSSGPGYRAPEVTTSVAPATTVLVGVTRVTLTAQGSDPDGDLLTYTWSLGDGSSASGGSVEHVYEQTGTFTATVTVSDGKGSSVQRSVSVTVVSLSGVWQTPGQQQFQCTQDHASLHCELAVAPLPCPSPGETVQCGLDATLGHPWLFAGHRSASQGNLDIGISTCTCTRGRSCEGEIRSNSRGVSLSSISCADLNLTR